MTFKSNLRKWLPHVLCCLPGVVAVAIAGFSLIIGETTFGSLFSGPLSLGLVALTLLVCPLSMGLIMWRSMNRKAISGDSSGMASCCTPSEAAPLEVASADRLAALRGRQEALERELAQLQRH